MSFFTTDKCPYCGKTVNTFQKVVAKLENEYLCSSCYKEILKKTNIPHNKINEYSIEEVRELIEATNDEIGEKRAWIESFQITVGNKFCLNEGTNEFAIPTDVKFFSGEIKDMDVYKCSDIIGFELLEDGNSISKGGVGRALVGGALFGGAGAIVGALTGGKTKNTCSRLEIKITMNNVRKPTVYTVLIHGEVERGSVIYDRAMKQAQEILSLLDIICKKNSLSNDNKPVPGGAAELREFKQLLDEGIITQEEFDAKKKQVLGL